MHVALDDRYTAESGRVLISGVQAIVRMLLDQRRLDTARDLDTRIFVSGYQGSPLGGLDQELTRAVRHLGPAGVVFQPGLNEELAATAVAGSQLVPYVPGAKHAGVTGFWYGKNPGLDRAADAIRHANLSGTSAVGGAVALIGDDPSSKSSTVPSACEQMCQSLSVPLLAPSSVAEIITYGLHAVAMSRASGLWTGLKIVADIADASTTLELPELGTGVPRPTRSDAAAPPSLIGPAAVDVEFDAITRRLNLARQYARDAGLNAVTFSAPRARLGVLSSGLAHAGVLRALDDLGLGEGELAALGVRLIRIGMPWPADRERLVELTGDLEQVLVVEDKTPFLQAQLTDALHGRSGAPVVVGRHDENGRPLLTAKGALSTEDVARALATRIGLDRLPAGAAERLELLSPRRRSRIALPLIANRTPYFCSGCPHNTSTRAGEDTLVGVGIGCHVMVALDGAGRGNQIGLTQMGGEGTQWIGLAPFTTDAHFVQNLGDGTFHHSGSLAVRAAVAAGLTMTYKLLYNDAVAMTGGQSAEGKMDVPTLTRWFALEGVRRVVVTTDEPRGYRRRQLDPIASVRHRDEFAAVERELAAVPGVTVIIHDDRCATEERRLRKRGQLPAITERVVINERVCEGCGDCGQKSTCLSVQPVATEFGRKTRIHQASCNSDFSCLQGDCPSFLLVEPGTVGKPTPPELPVALVDPVSRLTGDDTLVRMPGIGGTGVVTTSQILQMAAHLDGGHAAGLEQTGLAQKGGPVISDVRFSAKPLTGALRASRGRADVLLGFDLLGAATESNLQVAHAGRTIAVLDTAIVPTAEMVTGRAPLPGSPEEAIARVETATDPAANLYLDVQALSQRLFADHMPANMMLVGAAFQHGCLPLSAEAIEGAIELNGAAVATNLAAFRWGRAAVLDPAAVAAATTPAQLPTVAVDEAALRIARTVAASGELHDVVATRVADLIGYQDETYARRYAHEVRVVRDTACAAAGPDGGRVALAFARGLHTLMAYKDEYEVARLHLDTVQKAHRDAEFGADANVSVLLHPPALRALGMKRKLRLRRTAVPAFRVLRALRGLRGTRWDPFGYAHLRRVERKLVGEYRDLVRAGLDRLTPGSVDALVALAELTDLVRGYEDIKLAGVAEFRECATAALAALTALTPTPSPTPSPTLTPSPTHA